MVLEATNGHLLARGLEGTVWQGYAERSDGNRIVQREPIALKTIPGEFVTTDKFGAKPVEHDPADQYFAAVRAAKQAAYLQELAPHPRILRLVACEVAPNDQIYLATEFHPQGSLLNRMRQPIHAETAVRFISQAAEALQHVHDNGIIHRDVKPGNFLLDEKNNLVLADFGSAIRLASWPATAAKEAEAADRETMFGTAIYLAPEMTPQLYKPNDLTPAADQYSLAVMAYELFTGATPFKASQTGLLKAHLLTPPPDFAARAKRPLSPLDLAVQPAIQRALSKDPSERFASVTEFMLSLQEAALPYMSPDAKMQCPEATKRLELRMQQADLSIAEGLQSLNFGKSPASPDQQNEASIHLDNALRIDPNNLSARYVKVLLHKQAHRSPEDIRGLLDEIDALPARTVDETVTKGYAAMVAGKPDAAIAHLTSAIEGGYPNTKDLESTLRLAREQVRRAGSLGARIMRVLQRI